MPATILCTLDLPQPFPELIEGAVALRSLGRIPSHEELCDELRSRPVDALCPQLRDTIDAAGLDAGLPTLRCVSVYAVGYNNVDVAAATERGIAVANTPGVLTDATADCTVGLMLASARRLREGDAEVRAGRFHGWEPTYLLGLDLRDSRLGILGFGPIGQAVARRSLGFGMRVAYHDSTDPHVDEDLQPRVTKASMETLLRDADVISPQVPIT